MRALSFDRERVDRGSGSLRHNIDISVPVYIHRSLNATRNTQDRKQSRPEALVRQLRAAFLREKYLCSSTQVFNEKYLHGQERAVRYGRWAIQRLVSTLCFCLVPSSFLRDRKSHAQELRLLNEKRMEWEERHAGCTAALHLLVDDR